MDKSEMRRRMRLLNRALSSEARAAASAEIFRRAEELPAFATARTVALFCSLPDEPDTAWALERWRNEKRLALPRVEGETMSFRLLDRTTLVRGAFGIAEPGADAMPCDPGRIDLILVPGVAFTRDGLRLGRGRGYYDRYLSQPGMRVLKVGICYAHQLVERLPSEPHDVAMDRVLWA